MTRLRLSCSDCLGGETAAYVGQRSIRGQTTAVPPPVQSPVACRCRFLLGRGADLGDDMPRVVVATLLTARLIGKPDRTYGGDRYYGGYSDHLPVGCVVEH